VSAEHDDDRLARCDGHPDRRATGPEPPSTRSRSRSRQARRRTRTVRPGRRSLPRCPGPRRRSGTRPARRPPDGRARPRSGPPAAPSSARLDERTRRRGVADHGAGAQTTESSAQRSRRHGQRNCRPSIVTRRFRRGPRVAGGPRIHCTEPSHRRAGKRRACASTTRPATRSIGTAAEPTVGPSDDPSGRSRRTRTRRSGGTRVPRIGGAGRREIASVGRTHETCATQARRPRRDREHDTRDTTHGLAPVSGRAAGGRRQRIGAHSPAAGGPRAAGRRAHAGGPPSGPGSCAGGGQGPGAILRPEPRMHPGVPAVVPSVRPPGRAVPEVRRAGHVEAKFCPACATGSNARPQARRAADGARRR
jgi:hypothetical protein